MPTTNPAWYVCEGRALHRTRVRCEVLFFRLQTIIFFVGNRKGSHGVKSGLYGGFGNICTPEVDE